MFLPAESITAFLYPLRSKKSTVDNQKTENLTLDHIQAHSKGYGLPCFKRFKFSSDLITITEEALFDNFLDIPINHLYHHFPRLIFLGSYQARTLSPGG